MVKHLHSVGAASRLAALLLVQILPVFSLVAPCHPRIAALGATLDFHHGLPGREHDLSSLTLADICSVYGRSLTQWRSAA
jgi:hypothetical protein